jgi:hypothetical protein
MFSVRYEPNIYMKCGLFSLERFKQYDDDDDSYFNSIQYGSIQISSRSVRGQITDKTRTYIKVDK